MRKVLILAGIVAAASGCSKNKHGAGADTEDRGQHASMALLEPGKVAATYYHRIHKEPGENSSDKVGALLFVKGEIKADGEVRWGDPKRVDGDVREEGQNDVGMYSSLAIGADGLAQVSYYDKTTGDLKFARQLDEKEWEIETVDTAGNVGGWTSLVLENGDARIAYYDFDNGDLKLAVRSGAGSWNVVTVDGTDIDAGKFASLASDGNGNLGIAYHDATNGDLRYVVGTASGFGAPEVVDAAGVTGQWASLAYDLGTPVIAYHDFTNFDLRYARRGGASSWTLTTLDARDYVGADTAIVVDGDGHVTIAYFDGVNNDLFAASWDGSSWNVKKVVEQGATGYFNNVLLDQDDKPVFGSYDYTTTEFYALKPLS